MAHQAVLLIGIGLDHKAGIQIRREPFPVSGGAAVEHLHGVHDPLERDFHHPFRAPRYLGDAFGFGHVFRHRHSLGAEKQDGRRRNRDGISIGLPRLDDDIHQPGRLDLIARSRMVGGIREIFRIVQGKDILAVQVHRKRILPGMVDGSAKRHDGIAARREREILSSARETDDRLDDGSEIDPFRPGVVGRGVVRGNRSQTIAVQIDGLGRIVVDNKVFVTLPGSLLRGLAAASHIDFLDHQGTADGVEQRNRTGRVATQELDQAGSGSIKDMLTVPAGSRYRVQSVFQGKGRLSVEVGHPGIDGGGDDVVRPDRNGHPA